MAAKLGDVPPSTVKSWHRKQEIPAWRHESILAAAKRVGVALSRAELTSISPDTANDPLSHSEAA
jgi:hypothetical protein